MAKGIEWIKGTYLKQEEESAYESRQAVLSVNQGTYIKDSRCHSDSEVSFNEDLGMKEHLKSALVMLGYAAIFAVSCIIFFTIIIGFICTIIGIK